MNYRLPESNRDKSTTAMRPDSARPKRKPPHSNMLAESQAVAIAYSRKSIRTGVDAVITTQAELTGNTNSRVDLPVRWINYLTLDAIIRLLLIITLALRLRRPLMCRKSFLQ